MCKTRIQACLPLRLTLYEIKVFCLVFQSQSTSFKGGKGVVANEVLVTLNKPGVGSGQDKGRFLLCEVTVECNKAEPNGRIRPAFLLQSILGFFKDGDIHY